MRHYHWNEWEIGQVGRLLQPHDAWLQALWTAEWDSLDYAVFARTWIPHSTYARHQQSIATAVMETVQECTDAAAVCVRQMYSDLNGGVAVDGPLDISVSYDASWLTRGPALFTALEQPLI